MDLALTGKFVLGLTTARDVTSRQLKPCPLDVVSKAEDTP